MQFLKNVRIQNRLFTGFGLVVALIVALTIIGTNDVGQIDTKLTVINDLNTVKQRYAINFRGSVHDRAIAVRDLVLLSDPTDLQKSRQEIIDLTEMYAESAAGMARIFSQPENVDGDERRILRSIEEIEETTLPQIEGIISALNVGDRETALLMLITQARPNFTVWLARINQFIDLEEAKNNRLTGETRAIAENFRSQMLVFTGIALVLSVLVAAWAVSGVRPLKRLSDVVLQLSEGNLEVEVPNSSARDEIGMISSAVLVFRDNAVEARQMAAVAAEREAKERSAEEARKEQALQDEAQRKQAEEAAAEQARQDRRTEMLALADQFEASVMGLVEDLSDAANEMEQAAIHMSEALEKTMTDSEQVESRSTDANENAQQVAESANELARSVRLVSQQTLQSAAAAKGAVDQTRSAGADIAQLSEAARSIGDVVNLITDIAEQTNLLALNATIEAARAGEAGRGFAVVASEVKSLASQTAGATQRISEQVGDMQTATQKAVSAVDSIQGQISEIGQNADDIAIAVEEQDNSTGSIASNIEMVSSGTSAVTKTIVGVSTSARQSSQDAQTVLTSASSLREKASSLRENVQAFVNTVRDA
ncbi:MAG: MCP four helix bundle domain-containing protein [Kordiimonadaceae bacterium]|nr:MCP four helix bundle domain-containing protein [Kordiimonadaceae bacterium]MBO6567233.1 MCP four helix bundle domain-containing protein [Kordiimonadaceae bacterium]MBO6963553.1 MCP four helix bundle domain-containing protein [Kordiimonadaceae bacterium]